MKRIRQKQSIKRVRRETPGFTASKQELIAKLSSLWHSRLPGSSLLEAADLEQEGWIIDQECFVRPADTDT